MSKAHEKSAALWAETAAMNAETAAHWERMLSKHGNRHSYRAAAESARQAQKSAEGMVYLYTHWPPWWALWRNVRTEPK